MKNYISVNSQKIELTDDQVEKIIAAYNQQKTRLSDIAVEDTFKIRKHEFIVLEHSGDTAAVIRKDLLFDRKEFGRNNNYDGSYMDELCNKFADESLPLSEKKTLSSTR